MIAKKSEKFKRARESGQRTTTYPKFQQINGHHSFKEAAPSSFVEYEVRKRPGGKVALFNFDLARDIGLIPNGHPDEMNPHLEKEIIETFGLVIINEYDRLNNVKFDLKDIKKNKYMATRYLQLQHPNKQGKTSGDGRSIWNGQISHKGMTWDISSCGTGATCLSPMTHIKNKFFKTGDPTISYGCGLSEKDEGLATLYFSEVLHRNRMSTERILAIIEFRGGLSINVRAYKNLIRPSHIFRYLKQNDLEGLKNIVDYYIDRQMANEYKYGYGKNRRLQKEKGRYEIFLNEVTKAFAKTAARFEDDYIFCWMDWDGDNILMDGGIIDYGSIRQFGLFHHEYRYDDVERFSTSIVEQKNKAKYIVQTFAQIVDYINKKKRESIHKYSNHPALKEFDRLFHYYKNSNLFTKWDLTTNIDIIF